MTQNPRRNPLTPAQQRQKKDELKKFDPGGLILTHRFRPFRLAVDIGGSHGTLLSGILAGNPAARGILFDLPNVAAQAAARLRTVSEGQRVEVVGGDFFRSVPIGGDLYLMKQVLHDWNDGKCIEILKSVRGAVAPEGRLAIIERLLPDAVAPDPVFDFDMFMMIWTKGRERKLSEFKGLLERTGFALDGITRNHGRVSVIEAVPV